MTSGLQSLSIHGLRGFSSKQVVEFAIPTGLLGSGLTILTGPNSSGKSTIIEAFRAYLWRSQRPSFHEGMRNRRTNFVEIEFNYPDRTDKIESIRPGTSETMSNFGPGNVVPYVVPSRRHFAPYFSRHGQVYDRVAYLLTAGDSNFQQQRGPSLNLFEMRLFDIDSNPLKREAFDAIISQIIPNGVNWTIDQTESSQFVLRFLGDEKAHSAEGVGEGIASLFTLVAALYDSIPGGIIVIDEPELSLHPSLQRRLSKVLQEFSKDRQVIISTHSPYMIDHISISNGANLCRTWDRGNGTEVHQLGTAGRLSIDSLIKGNINNPHQFNLHSKEIFFLEDNILISEGQEDVVLLPRLMEQVDINLDAEIYGWGAGGASNIEHVCQLLKSLGFQKVAALFDRDEAKRVESLAGRFPTYHFMVLPADDIRTKKATFSKEEKVGLLDKNMQIRENLLGQTKELFYNAKNYFSENCI